MDADDRLLAPRDGRAIELRTGECREGHCLLGFDAFVYINVIWFGCWIGFGIENYPYGLLTMVVSLEAIFLSTFVLHTLPNGSQRRSRAANTLGLMLAAACIPIAAWTLAAYRERELNPRSLGYSARARVSNDQGKRLRSACSEAILGSSHFALLTVA